MNIIKKISFILFILLTVTGCEKVIDVDLNSGSPKFVFEGMITNASGPYTFSVTTTKNFDEDNNFPGVSGANITISDDAGNSEVLTMLSAGVYQTSSLIGVPGRTYYFSAKINDETFSAVSVMPAAVNMDTTFTYNFTDFGDTLKVVNVVYFDPAGIDNYYRHSMIINGKRHKSINISNDDATDGSAVSRGLFYRENGEGLKTGDSVTVEMFCIDKEVHNYFFGLNQTISQSAAAPANPVSNISGGALGYFSANTFQKKSLVVQ